MKILRSTLRLSIFVVALCLGSCDKGYQVRFTNYYIETMDSVIIGNNTLVFTNIPLLSQSDYSKIGSGDYKITCVTNNKKKVFFLNQHTPQRQWQKNHTDRCDQKF